MIRLLVVRSALKRDGGLGRPVGQVRTNALHKRFRGKSSHISSRTYAELAAGWLQAKAR